LDDAALFFFQSLKTALEGESNGTDYLVSGHDIERWLLKTIKAMAVSGNLAAGRQRLSGEFATDIRLLDMLERVQSWPQNTGLYCMMKAGDLTYNHDQFQVAPLTNSKGEICGLWTNIVGLSFVLLLESNPTPYPPDIKGAVFRPGKIIIRHPPAIHQVFLSWEDGRPHRGELTLQHVRKV
jgi:hypothetical protein